MRIITGEKIFQLEDNTAVAIGKFDGVHIGHRKLLAEILNKKKQGFQACVFTFDPAPSVFFGASDGKELTTKEEKRELFRRMGVDILIEFPMNQETASMPPDVFIVEILQNQMHAKWIVAGEDVSYGAKGAGNAELLFQMGRQLDFQTKIIKKVCMDGKEISSTDVRSAVEKGDMQRAKSLLGDPYMIRGRVLHGNKIGRTIGIPTVNLIPEKTKLLPPMGVYYTKVVVDSIIYKGVTNIGLRPTIEEAEKIVGVETYIYDFEKEIYDKEIMVEFLQYRRAEEKFNSIDDLKQTMMKDLEEGRKFFE